jgi:hypothetical protein
MAKILNPVSFIVRTIRPLWFPNAMSLAVDDRPFVAGKWVQNTVLHWFHRSKLWIDWHLCFPQTHPMNQIGILLHLHPKLEILWLKLNIIPRVKTVWICSLGIEITLVPWLSYIDLWPRRAIKIRLPHHDRLLWLLPWMSWLWRWCIWSLGVLSLSMFLKSINLRFNWYFSL